MLLLKKETHQQQSNLADYCRTGIQPSLINININNLPQYRRLVYNVICDTLETAYPITFSFLPTEVWEKLTYTFFVEHKCQTPQVWRMPLEFYEYCVKQNTLEEIQIPFLNDLLYFEWLELDVHTMEDVLYPTYQKKGDWLNDAIAINPEYKIVTLSYPVHITAPTDDLIEKKGNYFLLLYREKDTGNVQFINLSIIYAYALEKISEGELLKNILPNMNTLFQINDEPLLEKHVLAFLEDLKNRNFVLGFLKNNK